MWPWIPPLCCASTASTSLGASQGDSGISWLLRQDSIERPHRDEDVGGNVGGATSRDAARQKTETPGIRIVPPPARRLRHSPAGLPFC